MTGIRYGIQRLPAGKRRTSLREAADDVFDSFADQVLPFVAASARHDADIVGERDRAGAPISGSDAQVAGICRTHQRELETGDVIPGDQPIQHRPAGHAEDVRGLPPRA